jgi:magnesium transporter
MARHMKRFSRPGTAPGTLEAPAVRRVEKVTLEVIAYGPELCEERAVAGVDEVLPFLDTAAVTWLNVVGLHDLALLETLGNRFGLHPLALEDVLNTGQRPKLEEYDDHLFIVLRQIQLDAAIASEQLSLFLGRNYVITFQEAPGDVFEPVRERLRKGKGRLRKLAADYLAYALIDALIDGFFPVLERYGEKIEELEDELIEDPDRATLGKIHEVKKELLVLRRAAWPQREVVNALERQEPPLVHKETKLFLRDLYDHSIQIMDILETYRDLASGMLDVYLSSVSNRMNEVMKVLTVMASIFIPLTFLVGIYGMNFDPQAGPWNMPELHWRFGYPFIMLLMLGLGGGMFVYFRRKHWL